jgi:alpha-beta hydrolase superfamily lysophospholipase
MISWQEDVLGSPYEAAKLSLRPDSEGDVQATLVRRRVTPGEDSDRAVIHVHGFADYFFQKPAADFWVSRGYDFYALDLRKYGRSLLPHQTPNYTDDLTAYYEELDLAWLEVAGNHERIVVSGHSTGGLVTSLWLHDKKHPAVGLFLNSPWLDFQGDQLTRHLKLPIVKELGAFKPMVEIKRSTTGIYAKSLHRDHFGEWDFDLSLKPLQSFKAYAGWIRAIRIGQSRVATGLDIDCPVLMITSARSSDPADNHDPDASSTDIVLDVEQMRRRVGGLSHQVTMSMIEGAIHDVTLSGEPARARVFSRLGKWLTTETETPG